MKLIVLDPGHGGRDPGAVSGKAKESVIARQIVFRLKDKLLREGKINVRTSFELCGKDIVKDTWPAQERRKVLAEYNKKHQKIDYIISIHLNASRSPKASGLIICHNDNSSDAKTMYDTIVAYFDSIGINIRGNRKEPIVSRPDLSILRASLYSIVEEVFDKERIEKIKQKIDGALHIVDSNKTGRELTSLISEFLLPEPISFLKYGEFLTKMNKIVVPFEQNSILFVSDKKKHAKVPALLIELGFITNKSDLRIINENQYAFAESIGEGIYQITINREKIGNPNLIS